MQQPISISGAAHPEHRQRLIDIFSRHHDRHQNSGIVRKFKNIFRAGTAAHPADFLHSGLTQCGQIDREGLIAISSFAAHEGVQGKGDFAAAKELIVIIGQRGQKSGGLGLGVEADQ